MLLTLGSLIGLAAIGAFASAVAFSSVAIFFVGVFCAICAIALLWMGLITRRPMANLRGSEPRSSSSRPVERPAPETQRVPAEPEAGRRQMPEIVMPASTSIEGVATALLASAKGAGRAVRVIVWRADGASGKPVTIADIGDGPAAQTHVEGLGTALREGTTVLEMLASEGDEGQLRQRWRYIIPVSFSGISGAAAIEFAGDSPHAETINRIAAAFRLPLAAGLALSLARKESEAAAALLESARDLARLLDPEMVVSTTLQRALELTDASSGSIMLYDDDGATLRIAASKGIPTHVVESTAVRPGDGIAGWVALSGQPLIVEDLPGRSGSQRSRGVRSAVSVPLLDEDGVLGVLNVGSKSYPSSFAATDLSSLEALARQATVSLRNARAVASASDIYFDTLRALSLALEIKDPYAFGGTERIMNCANRLGSAMGLNADDAQALHIAAMLHDIGMSSAGETASVTQRPLSTVEREMLKMHPVIAADILEQGPALRAVAPIVYHHHERYDGTGYVGGLAGNSIPLGARILTVADAYVAMTSERPYRAAMSEKEAIAELRENAGTQFDPAVVDTFVSKVLAESDRVRGGSA